MKIKRLLKNGLFSATLLGCGMLHGHYKFCPNCGYCLKPPCPREYDPFRRNDGCPHMRDAGDYYSERWHKHFAEDRGPWVKNDDNLYTEEFKTPGHRQHSKKCAKKHWRKPSLGDKEYDKAPERPHHTKKARKFFGKKRFEEPLPESASEE